MSRRLALVTVAVVLMAGVLVQFSSASFTSTAGSTVGVSTDRVQNWLHLYSQSSDPDGLTGYFTRSPGGAPAATGMDETLSVNLGTFGRGKTDCNRVFTIKTPSSFPTGTSATVSVEVLEGSTPGQQSIKHVGFSDVGAGGSFVDTVSLGAGEKQQLNLQVRNPKSGVIYESTLVITVKYPGMTASYYQYAVPVVLAGG